MQNLQIILVTHPRTGDLRESLKYIYNLYVEYVVKNPLYTPGTPIKWVLVFFQSLFYDDPISYGFWLQVATLASFYGKVNLFGLLPFWRINCEQTVPKKRKYLKDSFFFNPMSCIYWLDLSPVNFILCCHWMIFSSSTHNNHIADYNCSSYFRNSFERNFICFLHQKDFEACYLFRNVKYNTKLEREA